MTATMMRPPRRLLNLPLAGVHRIDVALANECLVAWQHKLGACERPFRQEAYALELGDQIVAVAISASIVNGPVAGFQRTEVVELARLAACVPWANRIMLRLWREVCAPLWACWPVKAAVSYSLNAQHRGDLYRFDGWERVRSDCGSSGGGTWSSARNADDPAKGSKSLWVWRYGAEAAS